jgi:hypothetical protein
VLYVASHDLKDLLPVIDGRPELSAERFPRLKAVDGGSISMLVYA